MGCTCLDDSGACDWCQGYYAAMSDAKVKKPESYTEYLALPLEDKEALFRREIKEKSTIVIPKKEEAAQ